MVNFRHAYIRIGVHVHLQRDYGIGEKDTATLLSPYCVQFIKISCNFTYDLLTYPVLFSSIASNDADQRSGAYHKFPWDCWRHLSAVSGGIYPLCDWIRDGRVEHIQGASRRTVGIMYMWGDSRPR